VISSYVWILPAVIAAGWVLSWWGTRRIRWGLLSAAAVVSALCVTNGFLTKGPPVTPQTVGCSPAFECMNWGPIYWIEAGLIGFACCVVLTLVTLVAEIIIL